MAGLKSIQDLRNRVATFNNGLSSGAYIQQIIWDNDAYIVDMNAEEQLFEQGINRLGVDIMDYAPYSPLTIAIKEEKGQPTNRVTLRDTGDFEASFFLEVGDKQFEIKASDFKTEDLVRAANIGIDGRKYCGVDLAIYIPGLNEESKKRIIWQRIREQPL